MVKKKSQVINKFGFLQGRIFPRNLKKYNLFPNDWESEFKEAAKLNINYIEFLYDKDRKIERVFNDKKLSKKLKENNLIQLSVNYDILRFIDFFENKEDVIKDIKKLSKKGSKIIVLPFIDKSSYNHEKLSRSLNYLETKINTGIKFAIESENISFIKLKNIISKLPKNFGICYDTGNYISQKRNIFSDFTNYSDFIIHIHLKGKKFNYKTNKYVNCFFTECKQDLLKFLYLIKKNDYKEMVVMESFYQKNGLLDFKTNLKSIKQI